MIKPFSITRLPKIVFGEGRFQEVPEIVRSYGRRALIVTGSTSFQASHHWQELIDGLHDSEVEWEHVSVRGEPSPILVDETVQKYKVSKIDAVLAIGGGSVIDGAKAVAGLLPFGNSVMDHLEGVGRGVPYAGPPTPFIAVPTTAGTGSEATKNAVLSQPGVNGFKKSFRHDSLVPLVAVVDPVLTYTCPPDVTAASGMDALTQLLESYTSLNANPFTDALALSGLEAVRDGLKRAVEGAGEEGKLGRNRMAYAAMLSGITLAQAGLGAVHGLASPLGGYFPIPHNVACGAMLAPAAAVNISALRARDPESPALMKYARLGRLFAKSEERDMDKALDALIHTLVTWVKRFGIPGLSHYGVTEADLPKIAAGYGSKTNPVSLTEEELVKILRESLS